MDLLLESPLKILLKVLMMPSVFDKMQTKKESLTAKFIMLYLCY